MPTKKPRITAIVNQSTKDKVKAIAVKEDKSESEIAGILIDDGLKMIKDETPKI